jgi:hypothetical protein
LAFGALAQLYLNRGNGALPMKEKAKLLSERTVSQNSKSEEAVQLLRTGDFINVSENG